MNLLKPASIPMRPLLALTGLMLLLHAAVLRMAPASLNFDESSQPVRLLARGMVLATQQQSPPSALPITQTAATTQAARPRSAPLNAAPHQQGAPGAAGDGFALAVPAIPATTVAPVAPVELITPTVIEKAPTTDTPTAPAVTAAQSATTSTSHSAEPAPGATHATNAASEIQARPAVLRIPDPVRLKYRASAEAQGIPLSASGELHWHHDGRQYEARLSVGNFLRTRVQTSRGQIGGQGLLPVRFSDKSGSERAAHFERGPDGAGGKVVFSANSPSLALAPLAQDRLSVLLQLAAMLAGEPARFAPGAEFSLQVVGARDSDIWVFRLEGQELLDLPIGAQQTIKLTRLARREYDQKVEVWLAQAMGYLPARIRITEPNGNFVDQKLEKLETP